LQASRRQQEQIEAALERQTCPPIPTPKDTDLRGFMK
jgi:hypothetical protein